MSNEYNDESVSFFGYCNGKMSKVECAAFPRQYTEEIHIPVKKNGAIITGKNLTKDGGATVLKKDLYNGKCLIVLDFDIKYGNPPLTIQDLPESCRNTFIISTGGGGIHAYFWSEDFIRSATNTNVRSPKLKELDVRAEGGLVFAPGSAFEDHNYHPYSILRDSPIQTITKEDYDNIIKDVLRPQIVLRKGFNMILNGEIWLTHGAQKDTGLPEVKYWSALFREIYSQGGDPKDYYEQLEKTQPEFNRSVANYQWNYMLKNNSHNPDKRPSNIFYNKLFAPWDIRTVVPQTTENRTDETPWYYDFDAYWYDMYSESIKWIYESKQWVRYEKGVFAPIPEEEIKRIILEYFIEEDIKRAPTNINIAITTIQSYYHTSLKEYDEDNDLINIENGLLNVKSKELLPHTPAYLSLIQLPLTYKSKPDPTPYWDRIKSAYPEQMKLVETFIQSVILGDMRNELMMFIYGPTGCGKGTMLSVVKKMFEGVCAFQPIERIGGDFGLTPLIGKLINLNLDMSIVHIDASTMQILKSIVGRDEDVTVNIKHVREFPYRFDRMFFVNATNQLPTLASTDVSAWFRRVLLIHFDTTQPRDYDMKNGIVLEVDDIFSNLVNAPYKLIIAMDTDMKEFVDKNEMEWKYSSEPVQHICDDIFERVSDSFATERVDDCVNWVAHRLSEEKYGSMPFRILKSKVIDILSSKNIIVVRKDSMTQFKYIKIVDKEILKLRDEQIEEDLRSKSPIDVDRVLTGESYNKNNDIEMDLFGDDKETLKKWGLK